MKIDWDQSARPELDVCKCGWFRFEHVRKMPYIPRACGGDFKLLRPATPAEIAFQDKVAEWEKVNP